MSDLRAFDDIPGVAWVSSPEQFISVNRAKCNGCGDCVRVCLADAFKLRNKKAEVASLDRCMECAACFFICDPGAVEFSWPRGGTGYMSEWG